MVTFLLALKALLFASTASSRFFCLPMAPNLTLLVTGDGLDDTDDDSEVVNEQECLWRRTNVGSEVLLWLISVCYKMNTFIENLQKNCCV